MTQPPRMPSSPEERSATSAVGPQLARALSSISGHSSGRVVAIGNFDGVHRGHQILIGRGVQWAERQATDKRSALEIAVLTFDPHPASVLGAGALPMLTTLPRKRALLGDAGAELVTALTFDRAFAARSAESFVDEILVAGLNARRIIVGHDFRFGAQRRGDVAMLRARGATEGFEVDEVDAVSDGHGVLSSTRVRRAIDAGDLDDARAVLGRPHSVSGRVVHGAERGRTIGFPTANIVDAPEALPANGVYAVVVDRLASDDADYVDRPRALVAGVANIGVRPTIAGGDARPSIEVHLLDLPEGDRDLYDASLRVHLVARLRDERKFEGLPALRAQIAIDAEQARNATATIVRPTVGGWF